MHEVRHHLHKAAELDPVTGVPVLPLEDFCCAAHGFSALIVWTCLNPESYKLADIKSPGNK